MTRIRIYDALLWLTYWATTASERASIALSDRRSAIAVRLWDAEVNPWLLPDPNPMPRLSWLPWRKRR